MSNPVRRLCLASTLFFSIAAADSLQALTVTDYRVTIDRVRVGSEIVHCFCTDLFGTDIAGATITSPPGAIPPSAAYALAFDLDEGQWAYDENNSAGATEAKFPDGTYRFDVTYTNASTETIFVELNRAFPPFPVVLSFDSDALTWQPWDGLPNGLSIEVFIEAEDESSHDCELTTGATSCDLPPGFVEAGSMYFVDVLFLSSSVPHAFTNSEWFATLAPGPFGADPTVAVCSGVAHYTWVGFAGGGTNPDIFYRSCIVGGSCASSMKLVGAPTVEANPAVACQGDTVIVMWEDYRNGNADLAYRRSTDAGSFFGGLQFLVRGPSDEAEPTLAMSGGVAVAVWEDNRNGNDDLAGRRSVDSGETWGPLTFLVRSPFDDTDPVLGLDGSAGLLGWVDRRFGNQDIAYRRSTDSAASWQGLTFLVKAATVEKTPTLVVDGSMMMIAWSDSRFGNEDLAHRRSTSSGASFDGLKFLVRAPSDDSEPSIECSGLSCLMTWVDERSGNKNISFRHSADGGATCGPTKRLVAAPTDELGPACDLEGDLAACVWADTRTGEPKPHARHSLDGGMTWLPRFELDP